MTKEYSHRTEWCDCPENICFLRFLLLFSSQSLTLWTVSLGNMLQSALLPVAVINTGHLGKQRLYSASQVTANHQGKPGMELKQVLAGRNWSRRHGELTISDLLFMVCSACFHMKPWTTCPGVASLTMSCASLHQSLIKNMSHKHRSRSVWRR